MPSHCSEQNPSNWVIPKHTINYLMKSSVFKFNIETTKNVMNQMMEFIREVSSPSDYHRILHPYPGRRLPPRFLVQQFHRVFKVQLQLVDSLLHCQRMLPAALALPLVLLP